MFKTPGSNRPVPRPSRDGDDWIVLLTALGAACGFAGWLFVGGFSTLLPGTASRNLINVARDPVPAGDAVPLVPPSSTDETAPPAQSEAPALTDETIDSPTASSPNNLDPAPGDRPAAESALPPLPPLPDDMATSPDGSTIPPVSDGQPTVPLQVPEPPAPVDGDRPLASQPPSPQSFTDVPPGFWAKPYIDRLAAQGLVSGLPTRQFEPSRPMTRAEFTAQVARAFEMPPQRPGQSFTDIAPDFWGTSAIQSAVQMGFVTGYPNREFRPNEIVTRLQVLTALATGLSLTPPNASDALLQPYEDAAAIPDWAKDQVAAAIAAGIIAPSPTGINQLRPDEPATRAEVATLIYNTLAYMGQIAPLTAE